MDIVDLRIYLTNTDNPGDGSDETIDAEYAADFSVAKIFSDNMVVQRNEQISPHLVILVMSLKLMTGDVVAFVKPHMRNMMPGRKSI